MMSSIEEKYNLKTDNLEDTGSNDNNPKQGRLYSTKYASKPGGVRVDEMIYGIKMAHLSCTDDSDDRLKTSSANTKEALREVLRGSNDDDDSKVDIKLPLSQLLDKHFNLKLDRWIDESYWHKLRPVDTQAFIASNDTTIVLSYRYTTSKMDWLTNFDMTTSEWEPSKDEAIGHAGLFACIDGLYSKYCGCLKPCNGGKPPKPRIHTGFYNNFLHTIPMIREHILSKLTNPNTTPKKVYICGCSLGAAMATTAYIFILDEMVSLLEDPNYPSHKLILVNAGSPRVCVHTDMYNHVMDKVKRLQPLDRAVICRCVYNNDAVPHIPLNISGFIHLDKLVYITKDGGNVIINPKLPTEQQNITEIGALFHNATKKDETSTKQMDVDDDNDKQRSTLDEQQTKSEFQLECEKAPEPVRDHMPYWYLTYLEQLQKRVTAGEV